MQAGRQAVERAKPAQARQARQRLARRTAEQRHGVLAKGQKRVEARERDKEKKREEGEKSREEKRRVKRNGRRSEERVEPGGQERKSMEGVKMERRRGARQRDAGTGIEGQERGKGISYSGFQFSLA